MKEQEEDARQATIQEKANKTIRQLRIDSLAKSHTFMSFANHLPSDQAIHEYTDGKFKVLRITGVLAPVEFVRMAAPEEIAGVKKTNPAYPEFYL
jgi:hypothetical protein